MTTSSQPPVTAEQALHQLTRQAETLWQAIAPRLPTFTVEVLPTIASTNSALMQRARQGDQAPTLLVSVEQTAGRGRRGKTWLSRPGASLTFSLGIPLQPNDWSGLSLAVGVSLAERLHPDVRLKWPNDLWWHERKLGGILIEAATQGQQSYAVIGIGLNVLPPDTQAVAHLDASAAPAASLCEINPQDGSDAGWWLTQLVPGLVNDVLLFEQSGFKAFAQRFERRDALKGKALRTSDGQEGIAEGVTLQGALQLRTASGLLSLSSAEVSLRPC